MEAQEDNTQQPISTKPEVNTEHPINTEPEVNTEQQIITKSEIITEQDVDTQSEVTTEQNFNTEQEVNNQQEINTESEVNTEQQINTAAEMHTEHQVNSAQQAEAEQNVPKSEPNDEPNEAFLDELLFSADEIAAAVAETSNSNQRVKPEPSSNANEDEPIDPSFFDDLLVERNDEPRPNPEPDTNEPIDPHFFDDILERCEDGTPVSTSRSHRHRIKRERIELEDGEVDDSDERNHRNSSKPKKSKKSKQKKHKESPIKIKTEITDSSTKASSSSAAENKERPRIQVRAELRSFRVPTPTSPPDEEAEEQQTQIETHIGNSRRYQPIPFQLSVLHEPLDQKPEKELTSEEKLCKALERMMYAKRAFQKAKLQTEKHFYANDPVFSYTPTVRKLPTSFSHFTQQIYDNRSPLHTVNNVTFPFNSMVTRLNLEEWGLESLPSKAKVVARVLGYDVNTLFAKKQSIKIPNKIQNSLETTNKAENKEVCEKSNSSLFMNVMVQTDNVKVIPNRRRDFYRDVGLQSTPPSNVVGTQTDPLYLGSGSDMPLFNTIRQLNENQLEALDDFIQLILAPTSNSSMDIYQQRKRLADIYQTSQIPTVSSTSHKRSASEAGLSLPQPPPPPNIYINHDFVKIEPRESNNYHYSSPDRRRTQPSSRRNNHADSSSRFADWPGDEELSAPTAKFYGRGGMRR